MKSYVRREHVIYPVSQSVYFFEVVDFEACRGVAVCVACETPLAGHEVYRILCVETAYFGETLLCQKEREKNSLTHTV